MGPRAPSRAPLRALPQVRRRPPKLWSQRRKSPAPAQGRRCSTVAFALALHGGCLARLVLVLVQLLRLLYCSSRKRRRAWTTQLQMSEQHCKCIEKDTFFLMLFKPPKQLLLSCLRCAVSKLRVRWSFGDECRSRCVLNAKLYSF